MARHLTPSEVSALQQLRWNGKRKAGEDWAAAGLRLLKRLRRTGRDLPSARSVWRAFSRKLGKPEARGRAPLLNDGQKKKLRDAADYLNRRQSIAEVTIKQIKRRAFRGREICSDETARRALAELGLRWRPPRKKDRTYGRPPEGAA